MKINTNSWHYKINTRVFGFVPDYLCPYMRHLVASVLVGLWLMPLLRYFDRFHISFPDFGLFRFLERQKFLNIYTFYGGFFGLGFLMLVNGSDNWWIPIGSSIGGLAFYKYGKGFFAFLERRSPKIERRTRDSVFVNYVKSNHDKICPKLDFIDDKLIKFNEKVSQIDENKIKEKSSIKNKPEDLVKLDSEVK